MENSLHFNFEVKRLRSSSIRQCILFLFIYLKSILFSSLIRREMKNFLHLHSERLETVDCSNRVLHIICRQFLCVSGNAETLLAKPRK